MNRPVRSDLLAERPALGQKQAMKAVQDVLSPEAALIAHQIPRAEPLLRMIESNGFTVIGFSPAPFLEKPVKRVNDSPGSRALYQLLERRGYRVGLYDTPEGSENRTVDAEFGKVVSL
jgi:hypothetical protein